MTQEPTATLTDPAEAPSIDIQDPAETNQDPAITTPPVETNTDSGDENDAPAEDADPNLVGMGDNIGGLTVIGFDALKMLFLVQAPEGCCIDPYQDVELGDRYANTTWMSVAALQARKDKQTQAARG